MISDYSDYFMRIFRRHFVIVIDMGDLLGSIYNSLFNEFLCKLGFFWHEWTSLHTNELNIFFFVRRAP
jgi:hypothetical protein